ncbi:MAG: hypothetical protein DMF95_12490, partial [Acidobacteria bacterium]
ATVRGHAHYLLGLNEALRRSVIRRWARGRPAWSPSDGLIKVAPGTQAALAAYRLGRRPYSLSALQRFASCPYQFLLATIHRLEPWDEPEPLMRMDPLTRGSLFHKAQAEFYRAMEGRNELPVTRERLPGAARTLDGVIDRVAAEYAEKLAPAIERVWRDEIDELRRDLGIWVQKLADDQAWQPKYFELSFGLSDEGRDPRSLPDPVVVGGRFVLRGSVDLIEHRADLDVLRVTDHKTGKNRSTPDLIVGGGSTLQPVLYSLAVERGLGRRVVAGRLFYATTAGGFVAHEIPINDQRLHPRPRAGSAGDYRSRGRNRIPCSRAGRARLHVVRFPPRVRPARGRTHEAQIARTPGGPGGPEVHALRKHKGHKGDKGHRGKTEGR